MEILNETHLELPFLLAETTLFNGPISNTIPDEQITMGQVLLGILKGRWKNEVKNVRELKNQYLNSGNTENKNKWNRAKEKLPYFTVSVSCENGRDLNSVKGMSQLIQLDVDVEHDLGGKDLVEVKEILKNDPYVGALFQSTSGVNAGVKGIVSVEQANPEEWNIVALGLENYLYETYRIEQDKKMRSLTQPCFVSSGGVLINPNPVSFQWRNWIDVQEKKKSQKNPFELWDQQKWKNKSINWPKIFQEKGIVYKFQNEKVSVQCPWVENHTKDELKGTGLFLGDGRWCFKCHHSHCAEKNMTDLINHFGQDLVSKFAYSYESKAENPNSQKKISTKNSPLRLIKASEVKIKPLKWLWEGVLPRGKLVILAGDPGLGKSQVTLSSLATVSVGGKWPVSETNASLSNSIILSAEDSAEDTIVPRLKAAGANLDRISIIQAVETPNHQDRGFDITLDTIHLKKEIEKLGNVSLIVIDPISSYLGSTDSHQNSAVRGALNPIVQLADESDACLLCVTHLNKSSQGNALSRVTGSIAFTASARASYVITKDSDDPERRLMLPLKNNLAKDTEGYAYKVVEVELSEEIKATKVEWEDCFVSNSADEILNLNQDDGREQNDAEEFLYWELASGDSIPSKEIFRRGDEQGFSIKQLRRAMKKLEIKASKDSFDGGWSWIMPVKH